MESEMVLQDFIGKNLFPKKAPLLIKKVDSLLSIIFFSLTKLYFNLFDHEKHYYNFGLR